MTGPSSTPRVSDDCLLGWILLAGSMVVAGTAAFVASVAICRRWWG